LDEAEKMGRDSMAAHERALGKDDPSTLLSASTLADLLTETGKTAEAATLYDRAYQGLVKARGASHPSTLGVLYGRILILKTDRRIPQARRLAADLVYGARASLPKNHPDRIKYEQLQESLR
jgi:hypothetical protein